MTRPSFTPSQQAALDISKSVGVTASAGTGKTYLLKNRFIELLRSGARPGEILCLTFTDKAAAEMRDRIEEELRDQVRDEPDNVNLSRALEEIHHCTISTFHGFCSGLLREFPMEAEVPVSYTVMDSLATHNLVTDTIADVLQHPRKDLLSSVEYLWLHIADAGRLAAGIRLIYDTWAANADWFADLIADPRKVYDGWVAQIHEFLDRHVRPVWESVTTDPELKSFVYFADTGAKNVDEFRAAYETVVSAKTVQDQYLALLALTKQRHPMGKVYGELSKHCTSVKQEIRKQVPEGMTVPPFADDRVQFMLEVLRAFATVGRSVHDTVRKKMADGGYLNFEDLIHGVELLLDRKPEIRNELCRRYTYILVDEVQDNNPLLTRIVEILAGDIASGNKLFVVGDMKQSIYRFNGADPKRVQELLAKFPDDPVELDTNYRTVSPLIASINAVFTQVYGEGNTDGIRYSGVDASRKSEIGTMTVLTGRNTGRGKKTESKEELPAEGDLLASWIRHAIDAGTLM
ncbi:MAG TPA: UvrD-helicase domain-containing protein, partial [Methanocorpusculum sp.]|nr:UvrD-helicase domain-containing protein [Methanocorpusculum sp.]